MTVVVNQSNLLQEFQEEKDVHFKEVLSKVLCLDASLMSKKLAAHKLNKKLHKSLERSQTLNGTR